MFLMELNPIVSTGELIKNSDPMISTGVEKKYENYLFKNRKKRFQCYYLNNHIYNYL